MKYRGDLPHAGTLASLVGGRLVTASDGSFAASNVIPGERVYVSAVRGSIRSRPLTLLVGDATASQILIEF